MQSRITADQVLYGDHQRAGTPAPSPLVYGETLPYDHEALLSGRSLILMPALPGTGTREQLRKSLIDAGNVVDEQKLIICPPMLAAEWKRDNSRVRTISQDHARMHIDELLAAPPELLIIEDPHGVKTIPLLQRLAAAASRSIIRPFVGRNDLALLQGFPGDLLTPLPVNTDEIDGIS